MITLCESASAKLNLTLDVLSKRDDGYHDLKSVMQTVSVRDDIEIDLGTGKPWRLKCDKEGIPADERNLAWKAARVFCNALGRDPDGLEIRISKRIPSQAGMGGGSADAAAVLRALNQYYGKPLSTEALAELGAKVGSDVPFCVVGGTCMCEGRGEKLRRLPDMPGCYIVACKPEFSVSTPALFQQIDSVEILDHPNHEEMEAALNAGDLKQIARNAYNVFDPVVAADHPEVDQIKAICMDHGALAAQMTGSGSVVYAIVDNEELATEIQNRLKETFSEVFVCKPV